MFNKKPWSDALFPDFDDSFESRFYCFGGDGGGNKGGGGTPPPKENVYNPEDQEPERGRPTTTAPPPQKAEVYTGPFTSQIAEDIYKSGPERPPTDVQKGFGIADIAPQAVVGVGDVIDKKRLDNKTLASFPPNMPENNVMNNVLQEGLSPVYNQNLYNPEPSTLNLQNVYEEAVSPKELGGVDFLGGTLSPDFNFKDDKYGFKYVRRFNQGGIVSLLQPLGDYLGNQIDQQRVDPFLEMVENAAYQEFGIDPSSGGGGMGSVGFDLPGETFGPGQMEPQVGFEEPVLNVQPGKYISDNELTVSTGFLGRPALQDMPQVGGNMAPQNQMTNQLGEQRMTGDMQNYRQAQEDARRQRESGFMGRVVLPGEMSFEDFMGMQPQVNLLQDSPTPFQAQLQSAFGGIGSLF